MVLAHGMAGDLRCRRDLAPVGRRNTGPGNVETEAVKRTAETLADHSAADAEIRSEVGTVRIEQRQRARGGAKEDPLLTGEHPANHGTARNVARKPKTIPAYWRR